MVDFLLKKKKFHNRLYLNIIVVVWKMAFKIKTISLLFIIVISFILLINIAYGLKCKAGYGMQPTDIRTSGSQCSGLSKITTAAE